MLPCAGRRSKPRWGPTGVLGLLLALGVAQGASPPLSPLQQLGRSIFLDPSLSASGKESCSTCHDPKYAYGPPPGRTIAFGGPRMNQSGTRTVPSLRYLREVPPFKEEYKFLDGDVGPIGGMMWDGRAASLEEQAKLPLLAANEMANTGPADVARKLARAAYAPQFKALFGADIFKNPDKAFAAGLSALAAFQQVPAEFYPYSSRYDAYLRGDIDLTEQEERGADLFKDPDKGNCASCHLGTSRDGVPPPFTDFDFVNVGVPRNPRLPANADPRYYDLGLCGPNRRDLTKKRELCGFSAPPPCATAPSVRPSSTTVSTPLCGRSWSSTTSATCARRSSTPAIPTAACIGTTTCRPGIPTTSTTIRRSTASPVKPRRSRMRTSTTSSRF